MAKIQVVNTKDIHRFVPILTGLEGDFQTEHYPYFLTYCGILPEDKKDAGKYWKVWLATSTGRIVGVCGLYQAKRVDEVMWIGYFGALPDYRGTGVGAQMLAFMEQKAKENGNKKIAAYCTKEPLEWYFKNGFRPWEMNDAEKLYYEDYLGGDFIVVKNL